MISHFLGSLVVIVITSIVANHIVWSVSHAPKYWNWRLLIPLALILYMHWYTQQRRREILQQVAKDHQSRAHGIYCFCGWFFNNGISWEKHWQLVADEALFAKNFFWNRKNRRN